MAKVEQFVVSEYHVPFHITQWNVLRYCIRHISISCCNISDSVDGWKHLCCKFVQSIDNPERTSFNPVLLSSRQKMQYGVQDLVIYIPPALPMCSNVTLTAINMALQFKFRRNMIFGRVVADPIGEQCLRH